jgi:hypothetical protein
MKEQFTNETSTMRNAIVEIVQKALMSSQSESTDFIYNKEKISNLLKQDIDNFIKDFILFEKRY